MKGHVDSCWDGLDWTRRYSLQAGGGWGNETGTSTCRGPVVVEYVRVWNTCYIKKGAGSVPGLGKAVTNYYHQCR